MKSLVLQKSDELQKQLTFSRPPRGGVFMQSSCWLGRAFVGLHPFDTRMFSITTPKIYFSSRVENLEVIDSSNQTPKTL